MNHLLMIIFQKFCLVTLFRALFTSQEAIEDDPVEGANELKKVRYKTVLVCFRHPSKDFLQSATRL